MRQPSTTACVHKEVGRKIASDCRGGRKGGREGGRKGGREAGEGGRGGRDRRRGGNAASYLFLSVSSRRGHTTGSDAERGPTHGYTNASLHTPPSSASSSSLESNMDSPPASSLPW